MKWPIVITVLLTAGILFSALRYGRAKFLSMPAKMVLIALRAGWVVCLILSFWEPSFRFERFESGKMRIPVLIDASVSMRNFSPEAYVLPFLDTLAALQSRTGGSVSFEYFVFGDSTRSVLPSAPLSFTDSKSFFPAALDETGGRLSGDMIIISDGHWTRPRRSSDIFPRSTIRYLALPEANPNPFVTISCDAPEMSPVDSSFAVDVTASGFVRENSALRISLKVNNRAIKTETAEVPKGYFSHVVRFKTNNPRPGRKLYTVEAVIDTAVPPSVSSFVHQTTPHFLTYSMYSAKPTLDRRYMTQALLSNKFFREKSASPDILFLFDRDDTAEKLTRALPSHAVTVFLGAMPCSSGSVAAPSISIKQVDNNSSPISPNLDLRSMPPPQEIIICKQQPASGTKRILQASINTTGERADAAGVSTAGTNTASGVHANLPILFSGRHKGIQSLFCPVRGIWRWDFWPMSSDRTENELFSFSNTILSVAEELLLDNISDRLILYPSSMLTETDSAKFLMSLPAAVPIFEPVKLSVQIKNDDIGIDTTMHYSPTGLNRQPLAFRALPPGQYAISSSLTGSGVKAAFADSFTVNKDMSELSVLSQNTQYLKEFAQPLDIKESAPVFDSWAQRSTEKSTVTETIRIHRSWLLLGILLTLFAAELILRRLRDVD